MAERGNDLVTHITGNVGSDPKTFDTSKGKVLKFSVGVTIRYGENPETRWVNCSIWEDKKADVVAFVKKEISKGSAVAVDGFLKTDREYQGKKQFDLTVTRIGLVTWAKRSSSQPKAEETTSEDEELSW